jgi:hypothetical protein
MMIESKFAIGAKIAAALVAVQAELRVVKKNKMLRVEKEGRVVRATPYADLGAVWEGVHEVLTKHKVAVVQAGSFHDGVFFLRTILLHESGESVEGEYVVRPARDGDAQALGSAVTYARRYSMCAMLGIVTEDDDGAKASTRGKVADTGKVKEGLQEKLSAAERMALTKVAKKAGKTEQIVKTYLKEAYGVESTADLKKQDYQEVMAWCAEPKPNAAPPQQPELGDAA